MMVLLARLQAGDVQSSLEIVGRSIRAGSGLGCERERKRKCCNLFVVLFEPGAGRGIASQSLLVLRRLRYHSGIFFAIGRPLQFWGPFILEPAILAHARGDSGFGGCASWRAAHHGEPVPMNCFHQDL